MKVKGKENIVKFKNEINPYHNKKQKALRRGKWGETISCFMLRLKGYHIIARNMRLPVGEIDIIAKRANILCFIEVKARKTERAALEALGIHQQKRILRAAKSFLSRNQRYGNHQIRFDLITISPKNWPKHIQNAWTEF